MNCHLPDLIQRFAQRLGLDAPAPKAEAAGVVTGIPVDVASRMQQVDFAAKGYHLDVRIEPDQVVTAAQIMDENGFSIDTITGVDWLAEGAMEVVYDFLHVTCDLRVVIRARIPRDKPEISTISNIFPGANWHEREAHDFFGINFLGHPDLSPLLLPEDADYHPLRKDFAGDNS